MSEPESRLLELYPYVDEHGKVLYEVLRYEPKAFKQRIPLEDGKYLWSIPKDTRRVLWNLPDVLKAQEVFVTAGEKDSKTLISIGLVATTNAGGEGVKWISDDGVVTDFVHALKGKSVYIFPDQDRPGIEHGDNVLMALQGIAEHAWIVNVPEGKDVTEWFERGGTPEKLNKLIEIAKLSENAPAKRLGRLIRKRGEPAAVESEKLVIGSILSGRTRFGEIDHLKHDDFYLEAHQIIFAAIEHCNKEHKTDRAAVSQYLEDQNKLESVGGISALLDLTEDLPAAYNIESHTEAILEKSANRRLIKELVDGVEDLVVGNDSNQVRTKIVSAANQPSGKTEKLQTHSVVEIVKDIDEFLKPKKKGLMCKAIDPILETCYGLHRGHLIIIAGRPSYGKTSALSQLMISSVASGLSTDMFSFEVGKEDVLIKLACTAAKVPYLSVISGTATEKQNERLRASLNSLMAMPLRIDDRNDWSVSKFYNYFRRRKAQGNPVDVIGIDYLQLMSANGFARKDLEIGYITKSFKSMAKEFNMVVILLSQLSRDSDKGGGRLPILSDLRSSGDIEQDADEVFFVWQDYSTDQPDSFERKAKIILAKQRNGPVGEFDVQFIKPYALFMCPGAISLDYPKLMD